MNYPGIKFTKFSQLYNFDQQFDKIPPTPRTPACILFTSGATGKPKGCVLTHENIISATAAYFHSAYPFSISDSTISYLPLAHIFEAVLEVIGLACLGKIYIYSGSIDRLLEEVKLSQPTAFLGVARVYERIYSGIKSKLALKPYYVRAIFHTTFYIKSFLLKFRIRHIPLLDHVFDQIRESFGGQLRCMVQGGSPCTLR